MDEKKACDEKREKEELKDVERFGILELRSFGTTEEFPASLSFSQLLYFLLASTNTN